MQEKERLSNDPRRNHHAASKHAALRGGDRSPTDLLQTSTKKEMSAGKGTRPIIGRNDSNYREGYDQINWGRPTPADALIKWYRSIGIPQPDPVSQMPSTAFIDLAKGMDEAAMPAIKFRNGSKVLCNAEPQAVRRLSNLIIDY